MGQDLSFFFNALMGSCRAIYKINTKTKMMNIYRYDNEEWPTPEIAVNGEVFLNTFIHNRTIDEEDIWQFERLRHIDEIAVRCYDEKHVAILVYRRLERGRKIWTRMELMISQDYSEDNPEIIAFGYDMSKREANFIESCNTMFNQFYKVLRVDFTKNEFQLLKELPAERSMNQRLERGKFIPGMSYGRDIYVHPDDFQAFREFTRQENIIRYFEEGNTNCQIYYRRRIGNLYRWVKLFISPASDYTDENRVFFLYISDVHKEILHVMNMVPGLQFTQHYTGETGKISPIYYDNLLEVLSSFTQKYDEFSFIDLQKDMIIHYTVKGSLVEGSMPYVSNYSQSLRYFIGHHLKEEDKDKVRSFDSPAKLKKMLKHRMTAEYTYTLYNGIRCKTVLRKLEAVGGTPTKVLSYSVVCPDEHRLTVRTFGNFEVLGDDGRPVHFTRKQAKQVFAYLIDKQGFPVTSRDIVEDVLEKTMDDLNAVKYVSTLVKCAMKNLEDAGYPGVIVKEQKSVHVDTRKVDCDYYNLLKGDDSYWEFYQNEYMKEYSWAEETNGEIMDLASR